jgi:hypothetical protein
VTDVNVQIDRLPVDIRVAEREAFRSRRNLHALEKILLGRKNGFELKAPSTRVFVALFVEILAAAAAPFCADFDDICDGEVPPTATTLALVAIDVLIQFGFVVLRFELSQLFVEGALNLC